MKLIFGYENEVPAIAKTAPNLLPAIPGTMKLDQLKTVDRLKLSHSDVGCACDSELKCNCYKLLSFLFPDKKTYDRTEQETIELPEPERIDSVEQNSPIENIIYAESSVHKNITVKIPNIPEPKTQPSIPTKRTKSRKLSSVAVDKA